MPATCYYTFPPWETVNYSDHNSQYVLFPIVVSGNGALSHQEEVTNTEACNAGGLAFFISVFGCQFFITLSEK